MKGSTYSTGFKQALERAKIQKYANIGLSIAVLLLTLMAFNQRERVVVVPPVVSDQYEISFNSANASYYKSWALYVSTFLGNINPGNATFVAEGLETSFSPELYKKMQQGILEQAEDLRLTGRALRFYPDRVMYEKKSQKTFVTGKQEIVSSSGAVKEQEVVYEMQVQIQNGKPVVSQFEFYAGAPRTLDWLAKHGGNAGG
jgi:type IV conjugative transfer system protein TraE